MSGCVWVCVTAAQMEASVFMLPDIEIINACHKAWRIPLDKQPHTGDSSSSIFSCSKTSILFFIAAPTTAGCKFPTSNSYYL